MKDFSISSDLTIAGTKLTLDGKEATKKLNIIGISFYASSSVKEDNDNEYSGWVDLSITTADENGTVETKTYRKSDYMSKKAPIGKIIKDFLDNVKPESVVRYVGAEADSEVKKLSDTIVDHCKENEIQCPDSEALYNRSLDSLKDKAEDLGINIED